MLGTFLGLESALRGLQTQQAAIETASHNIDNANTPGFSRQRVDTVASMSLSIYSGTGLPQQLGTGVQIGQVTRLRNQFLDTQYYQQNASLGQWSTQQSTLDNISSVINEPSTTGISSALQNFWNAWSKLSPDSEDLSSRMQVQQSAETLTATISQTGQQLDNLQSDLQNNVSSTVVQANSLLQQIAGANQNISRAQATGAQPNDLLDQRDQLTQQLSQLADVQVTQNAGGYQISIGGTMVLKNDSVLYTLSDQSPAQNPANEISWTSVQSGTLKGMQNSLNDVQSYQSDLNSLANTLANGTMSIPLAGEWSIPGPADGSSPVFPVAGTFPDGQSFKAGDAVSSYTNESQYISMSSGPNNTQVATITQGATVTVNGINGLHSLGFGQDGEADAFFGPSSGLKFTLTAPSSANASGAATSIAIDTANSTSGTLSFLGLSSLTQAIQGSDATPTPAQVTGTNNLNSTPSNAAGNLVFSLNGGALQTVSITDGETASSIVNAINAVVPNTASLSQSGNLVLASSGTGTSSTLSVDSSSSSAVLAYLGLAVGTAQGSAGQASPATAFSSVNLNSAPATASQAGTLKFSVNGSNFSVSVAAGESVNNVIGDINKAVGTNVASLTGAPITADNISVIPNIEDIAASLRNVSGSLQGMSGSGTLAMTINSMKDTKLTFPDPANPGHNMTGTIDTYLQSVVGRLGVEGQQANNQVKNQQALVQQVDNQRQSVSGVSIDEEMSNTVKFQQSYSAAARLMETMNEMLQTLINIPTGQ